MVLFEQRVFIKFAYCNYSAHISEAKVYTYGALYVDLHSRNTTVKVVSK